jgi:hypothetical protein
MTILSNESRARIIDAAKQLDECEFDHGLLAVLDEDKTINHVFSTFEDLEENELVVVHKIATLALRDQGVDV